MVKRDCKPTLSPKIVVDDLETKIELVTLTIGCLPNILDFLVKGGIKGIVVEAFGSGNVQPSMHKAFR